MKIAMANDHAGTQMKEEIKAYLLSEGYKVSNCVFPIKHIRSLDLLD